MQNSHVTGLFKRLFLKRVIFFSLKGLNQYQTKKFENNIARGKR